MSRNSSRAGARLTERQRRRRNAIDSSLGTRDAVRYAGEIVGYVRREGGAPERVDAERVARTMPWWEPGLVLDSRDQKWWCWRRAVEQ